MALEEQQVQKFGQIILEHREDKKLFNMHIWSQSLINRMMSNETFRVAALRFTDVAPTLRSDDEFMNHLSAYFANIGGLKSFIGDGIPGSGFLGKVIAPLGRRNIKSMAKMFIAGETLSDGIKTFAKLHKNNLACSIDLLGESVISPSEAKHFTSAYKEAIEKIACTSKNWQTPTYPEQDAIGKIARANISVKFSALYEHLNPVSHTKSVEELCIRYRNLLDVAMENNAYIHIDTEYFELLPITMEVFETVLMEEKYRDYLHVGIVCQAYLKTADEILNRLINLAKKRGTAFSIRLVKGAYWDHEQALSQQRGWPCPVFSQKAQSDIMYEKLTKKLINSFPLVRPCIGSHNARSLAVAIAAIETRGLEKGDVEFQVLYGMADSFRNALRDMGYRVRQYCPVGEFIPGMSYLVRRLLENTANQSFLKQSSSANTTTEDLLQIPQVTKSKNQDQEQNNKFHNHPLMDFSLEENRIKAEKALEYFPKSLPMEVNPVINGEYIRCRNKFIHLCPWDTSKTITEVNLATKKHAQSAIESASKSVKNWGKASANTRAIILENAADICEREWSELFALQVYEAGKDWVHADADIAEGIDFLRFYAKEIRNLNSNFQPQSLWGEVNNTIYEPRGITAVIAPWNFPFAISIGMTSAALVAGNPVIYKPAEQTSGTGRKMYNILIEAGIPHDVLHFLPGRGEEVGAELIHNKKVAMVAFTGSQEVGLKIIEETAKVQKGQRHLKKCVIEMGGKNAIIVDSDADLDEAVPAVVNSAFGFSGQKCSACSRVIVVGSAYDTFCSRLKEMVEGLQVGKPTNPANHINCVIDKDAYNKVNKYIKIGKKDGKLLAESNKLEGSYFANPTVFINLKKSSKLTSDEIFGPVLAIYKAKTIEEAVEIATDSDYALTGGLFSRNPNSVDYVKENFKVGNLYINRSITGALVNRQPFGGGRLSGTGTKAGGKDYLLNFLEPRVITENTMRRGFAPKEDE